MHRISFENIRVLAIECHALDLSGYKLFVDGTHSINRNTRNIYDELVTSKLLMLAISIRTKFYQGTPHEGTERFISASGFLDKEIKGSATTESFTIKDVCDKIIHAESVERDFLDGNYGSITTIRGSRRNLKNQELWTLSISISLFTQAILNWLEEVPEA